MQKKIDKAIYILLRAGEDLTSQQRSLLQTVVKPIYQNLVRENPNAPLLITPRFTATLENGIVKIIEVLSDDGQICTVRGPYGIGNGPSNPSSQVCCSGCGMAAFNGARCVICGMMDD